MRKCIFSLLFAAVFALTPAIPSLAAAPSGGSWVSDSHGWTFVNRDNTTPRNTWEIVDGKYYYFDENGYILTDATAPDGNAVDKTGAKVVNGSHVVCGIDTGFIPTTIQAEAPTLEDTGISAQVGADKEDMIKSLGSIQACVGIRNDPNLYTFEKAPSTVFKIVTSTGTGPYCLNAYGPFAAFFTCSGTDTITCARLEEVLGVKITIGAAMFEDRHYAEFTYNGYDYSIFNCTHEGVFQGDVAVSVTTHVDWNQYKGFYDESGTWIGL